MKTFSMFIATLLLAGCVSTSTIKPIPQMPLEPNWQVLTTAPIVDKQGDDWLVTNQFIVRCGQEHDYLRQIKDWKQRNAVP